MKTRAILFILSLWILAFILSVQAANAKALRVATRETPPFSFNIQMLRMLDSPVWRELRTRHLGEWKAAQLFMR
jgi:hypothetical protein